MSNVITVIIALFAALGISAPATASAVVAGQTSQTEIVDETGIVVWDEKTNSETLIDKVTLRSGSKSPFLYIVPTPVEPSVTAIAGDPTRYLNRAYHSVTKHNDITGIRIISGVSQMAQSFQPDPPAQHFPGATPTTAATNTTCQYTILPLKDTQDVAGWLREQGFDSDIRLQDWLQPYVNRGWVLTVFRISPTKSEQNIVRPPAFTLTFRAYKPFFPYHEPQAPSSGAETATAHIRMYVVSNARLDAVGLGRSDRWTQMARWSAAFPEAAERELLQAGANQTGLIQSQIPAQPWVNVFDDAGSPESRSTDLLFFPSPDQSPQAAVIQTTSDRRTALPIDLLLIATAAIILGAIKWRTATRKRANGLAGKRSRRAQTAAGKKQPRRSSPADLTAPWNGQPPPDQQKVVQPAPDYISAEGTSFDPVQDGIPLIDATPWIDIPSAPLQMPGVFTVMPISKGNGRATPSPEPEEGPQPLPESTWIGPPARSQFKRRRKASSGSQAPENKTE